MSGVEQRGETEHILNTRVRPAACSCGKAKYVGSPTFVRERHAMHVDDVRERESITRLGASS